MKALLIAILAGTASPALAQHAGHGDHAPPPQQQADKHAGHGEAKEDPHAGHHMPQAAPPADPHAGHGAGKEPQADPHAGHHMPSHAGKPVAPPIAPPPPGAFAGPADAADLVYGQEAMRGPRAEMIRSHGRIVTQRLRIDRLEIASGEDGETYLWDGDFRYGAEIDRLWVKSEGEGAFGEGLEQGEAQLLWGRAISPYFDLQTGLRQDFGQGPDRSHLAVGLQGTAPYWFEIDVAAFLSHKGEVTARLEAEYDLLITQRLILQPRVEADLSLQDMPELGTGAGLSSAEAGIRLRYEIVPEFAPYLGLEYERAFGDTADYRRLAGEDAGGWRLIAGIRAWF